jgi:hypothetical protein
MTDPTPLDPDQILCRRCESPAGVPCQTPTGARSRSIHVERRRDAAAGVIPQPKQPRDKRGSTSRKSPATPEGRAKGGQRAAQERRRRRSEAAAAVEAAREAAEREAIEREATKLAEDAVRYERDRAILRRQTLDAAGLAYDRLIEGLRGVQRINVDDEGKPQTRPEEYVDRHGDARVREVPDVRGAYPAATVERLAKIAASTLVSLRLEEEKPTGIVRSEGDGSSPAEILGRAGVEELLAWATDNLPRET